jgi:hypothetical protein
MPRLASQALTTALLRPDEWLSPQKLKALCRVVQSLLAAMAQHEPLEVYAQTRGGDFWYKVYIMAPRGALRMDTGGESVRTKQRARATIRHEQLQSVTLDALMTNWQQYGIRPRRAIGLMLYEAWRTSNPHRGGT